MSPNVFQVFSMSHVDHQSHLGFLPQLWSQLFQSSPGRLCSDTGTARGFSDVHRHATPLSTLLKADFDSAGLLWRLRLAFLPGGAAAAGLWTTLGGALAPLALGLAGRQGDGMGQVISGAFRRSPWPRNFRVLS